MADLPLAARPRQSSRAEVLATLAIVLGLAGIVVAGRIAHRLASHPSEAECGALLDRYVEHLAHAFEPSPSLSAIAEARLLAREKADSNVELAACADELTRDQARCAMAAHDADEFERCLE
jgi:hypothetical protein